MSERNELDLETWEGAVPPPLAAAVTNAVGDAPAVVEPLWPSWIRFAIAASVGVVATAIAFAMFGSQVENLVQGARPLWWFVSLGAWGAAALVLTWMAVKEAEPTVPVRSNTRAIAMIGLAVGFTALAVAAEITLTGSVGSFDGGPTCLLFGVALETGPLLVLFLLVARGRAFRPGRAGLLAGVAAAAWSILFLELHCGAVTTLHKVAFHLGVGLAWGLVGAGIGVWMGRRGRGTPQAR